MSSSSMTQPRRFSARMAVGWETLTALPVMTLIGCTGALALAALNLVDVRGHEGVAKLGIDFQVVAKLASLSLLAGFAAYTWLVNHQLREVLMSLPIALIAAVIALFAATSLTGIDPRAAMVSSISLAIVLVGIPALAMKIGPRGVAWLLLGGQFAYLLGSWAFYWFVPEIGVFQEPLSEGRFLSRMAGLAHPNTLGLFSALTIVVSLSLIVREPAAAGKRFIVSNGPLIVAALLAVATLYLTRSRTPLLALAVSLGWSYRRILWQGIAVRSGLVFLAVCLGLLLYLEAHGDLERFSEKPLGAMLSKSGEAEELTSLTGRATIWSYTVKLIGERPVQGWGATCSKELLRDYMSYAHNTTLHIALSAGVLAAALFVAAMVGYLVGMLRNPAPLPDAVFVLLLVNGLTENVAFEYLAAGPTAWLVLVMAWRAIERRRPTGETRA